MWVKLAILLLGVLLLGGAVQKFGLPGYPKQAEAPATPAPSPASPPAPASPSAPAPQQQAAVQPAVPSAPAVPAPGAPAPSQPGAGAPSATSPPAEAKPAEATDAPTFDIVRVEPDGTSVVAGRAAPGARVELLLNGTVHDSAVADRSGQFALVPPRIPTGNHELTLAIVQPDGRREPSRQTVTLAIPGSTGGDVIVALAQPDKPTELLSRPKSVASALPAQTAVPAAPAIPAAPAAPAASAGSRPRIVVATVEAEDSGRFYATGQAAGNATVRLYLNETFLATARAGGDGRWSFTIGRGLEPGAYRVRLDDVDPSTGSVLSRAEVPFTFSPRVASTSPVAVMPGRPAAPPAAGATSGAAQPPAVSSGQPGAPATQAPAPAPASPAEPQAPAVAANVPPSLTQGADAVIPEIRSAMVSRGDSLWRISRRIYGKGVRYTVIYEANQQQIRDPKLIYPGQMFVLPADKQP